MKTSRFLLRRTGTAGFLSRTFHAARRGDRHASILKVGPQDPVARRFSKRIQSFRRESAAYKLLQPFAGKVVPKCLASFSNSDGSDGLLWLDKIEPARSGNQLAGLSWKELVATVRSIGTVHARFWSARKPTHLHHLPFQRYNLAHETEPRLRGFRKYCRGLLQPKDEGVLLTIPDVISRALRECRHRPSTLLHGDLRADNLLFSRGRVFLVDWQIAAWGLGTFDLARVIGGSSQRPLRLSEQQKLVRIWHQTLKEGGVRKYTLEEAWQDYRVGVALTLSIPITNGPTLARLSPRGKKIARLMIRRFFRNGREFGLL